MDKKSLNNNKFIKLIDFYKNIIGEIIIKSNFNNRELDLKDNKFKWLN